MLVFVDESGCPGMKLGGGATPNFTVTMVAFEEFEAANATEARIRALRTELGLPPGFEFHFSKLRSDFRIAFMQAMASCDFFYFTLTINKERLYGPGFQFPDSFYKYTCRLVFENAKPYLQDAIVVIDGSGSRKFRQELSSYFRQRINAPGDGCRFIKKTKMQDSRQNDLLQLADMVCGACARLYSGKPNANEYRKIISHREMSSQYWPK